ncbi:PREDICTED: caspase-8 isoform X1 [Corvus brachyrhynchos]|uniref:caspase-8 isoform X1 n=1 Tax=Corvus brachyrhynchos TaxID=85066 RepID=UPI0004DDE712|nr:PREDICTED: caspase-8 isoform X1 [Corvus brachyrhynchos]XP_017583723.1 PREDICTED: caspase-8 isoform X1 [Corvus brachyrhynchos]XP_017583733.1 PREDICTED: caspase-8 isoform X1 [Corvus brachyrhynchos]
MSRDFRKLLFEVSEALVTDELSALKFLSLEHVPRRKLEAIQEPKAFFEVLQEKDMIGVGNLSLLKELLYRIGRIDLLTAHLGSSREEMERELQLPGRAQVSAYRYLLFQLSEDITEDELMSFKLLLVKDLPKSKLTRETTMLDILTEMEKKGLLGKDNLSMLKSLCEKINISLWSRIEDGLNLFGQEEMLVTQEERGSTGSSGGHLVSSVAPYLPGNFNDSSQLLEAYKMTSRPCGVCLILNNHNFAKAREGVLEHKHMKDRNGTDVDAEALRNVFSKLHFRVEEYRDLTAEEIRKTVNNFRNEDHEDKDCFVCCILSHGKKGIIYGVDGQEVPIRELTTSFTVQNCNSLAGKPKVFFIQACQGDAFHKGVTIETDSGEQDSSVERDARFQLECIPAEADFLLGMATLQDYVSYRSPREGTWYIQALCQHLEYSCPRGEDVLTILTAVNQEVSRKSCERDAKKQMPQPSFTLRKRLIFPVN